MKLAYSIVTVFLLSFTITSCKKNKEKDLTVQNRLDEGASVMQILETYPLDSLYGKLYNGGYIFYIDENSGGGMVAATEDQNENATWSDLDDVVIGADGESIGSGWANTNAIADSCTQDFAGANICLDLSHNGYGNWYLPSKEELLLMHKNLYKNGYGNLTDDYYWSSTSNTSLGAWQVHFLDGTAAYSTRSNLHHVRAVLSF